MSILNVRIKGGRENKIHTYSGLIYIYTRDIKWEDWICEETQLMWVAWVHSIYHIQRGKSFVMVLQLFWHLQRSYQIYLKCEISGSVCQSQLCPWLWRGQSFTPYKHRRIEVLIVGFFGAAPAVIPRLMRHITLAVREGQVLQTLFLWSVGEPMWVLLECRCDPVFW